MVWKGKEMTPSKKKLSYLYWVIEESKDELQKMLDKPSNSHAVRSRNDFIAGQTENIQRSCRKTSTSARGDRIILWTGKLNRSQPSADPEAGGGAWGPTPPPPGKSQVIWVSVGNKQLDPPPWKKLDPPPLMKIPWSAHGSRQLIGMTTVNLGVVCKLTFCFSTWKYRCKCKVGETGTKWYMGQNETARFIKRWCNI